MKIHNDVVINDNYSMTDDEGRQHLFWPIYSYDDYGNGIVKKDMISFPSMDEIKLSYQLAKEWRSIQNPSTIEMQGRQIRSCIKSAGDEFWSDLGDCNVAYIVDKKFSPIEFKLMITFLGREKNIRLQELSIFCGSDLGKIKELKKICKAQFSIALYAIPKGPLYEIHDRFAVLDDEIWHFGGTVGGINAQLTAYSRGWMDSDGSFRKYIKSMIGNN